MKTPASDPLLLLPRSPDDEPVPAGADERVLIRLRASLAAGGGAAVVPANSASRGVDLPIGVMRKPWAGKSIVRHGTPWSVVGGAALMLGGVLGIAAGVAWERQRARAVSLDRTAADAPVSAPAAPPSSPPSIDGASLPAPVPSAAAPASAPRNDGSSSLAGEQRLLDRARSLMAADEPARALVILQQHARAYPQGRLVEEREAMAVNALASSGRRAEARARGRRFCKQFPNSLVLPSVEAALASIAED